MRPDIQAVVHAHPPTATGFAASGMALTQPLICELVIGLGCVPLAKYGTPGTPELADGLSPLIPQYDAILMANHGVVTYGENLLEAYMKMETVEHFARVALVARILGHEQPLNDVDIEKLVAARKNYAGAKSAAPMPPAPHNGDNRNGFRPAGRPRESNHKISSTRSAR
jgi:L-fuculose-phosphate aldolase